MGLTLWLLVALVFVVSAFSFGWWIGYRIEKRGN